MACCRLLHLLCCRRCSGRRRAGTAQAGQPDDQQRRCLTLIAYAEAAGEGSRGMLAVMKVVHNRVAHPDFADDICAVALERGQFQPVSERPALRHALERPDRAEPRRGAGCQLHRLRASAGRGVAAGGRRRDLARARPDRRRALFRQSAPDGPGQVPLVRRPEAHGGDRRARVHGPLRTRASAAVGRPWTAPRPAAAMAGIAGSPAGQASGLFHPNGPRVATRTATVSDAARLEADRRAGPTAGRAEAVFQAGLVQRRLSATPRPV